MKHKTINGWTKKLMKAQIRLNMRAKSMDRDGCRYRYVREGKPTACAVGCFIPDNLYHAEMDSWSKDNSIYSILKRFSILKKKLPLDKYGLDKLQEQHDQFTGNPEECAEHVCKWIDENVEDGE